eukprot:3530142-Pleurochrysis_carterae.AAC.1
MDLVWGEYGVSMGSTCGENETNAGRIAGEYGVDMVYQVNFRTNFVLTAIRTRICGSEMGGEGKGEERGRLGKASEAGLERWEWTDGNAWLEPSAIRAVRDPSWSGGRCAQVPRQQEELDLAALGMERGTGWSERVRTGETRIGFRSECSARTSAFRVGKR